MWFNRLDPKSAGISGCAQKTFNYFFCWASLFRTLGFLDPEPDEIEVKHSGNQINC